MVVVGVRKEHIVDCLYTLCLKFAVYNVPRRSRAEFASYIHYHYLPVGESDKYAISLPYVKHFDFESTVRHECRIFLVGISLIPLGNALEVLYYLAPHTLDAYVNNRRDKRDYYYHGNDCD